MKNVAVLVNFEQGRTLVGLAGSQLVHSNNLALAIILHRLGVGLALWLIVQPAFGRRAALLVLSLIAAATVLGYSLSEIMLPLAGKNSVLIIQALIERGL